MRLPELTGYVISDITVMVRCPYCREWHVHGREHEGNLDELGHRQSHCRNHSNPGYIITKQAPLSELRLPKLRRARR